MILKLKNFGIFSMFFFLLACQTGSNEAQTSKKKQVSAGIVHSTKGKKSQQIGKYWTDLKKSIKITDEKITTLKKLKNDLRQDLKLAKDKKSKNAVRKSYRQKEIGVLGKKDWKQKRNFDNSWNNPMSLYNQQKKLKLSNEQVKSIRFIKKEVKQKIKTAKKVHQDKNKQKVAIENIRQEEEKDILAILSSEQRVKYESIKKKISPKRLSRLQKFQ